MTSALLISSPRLGTFRSFTTEEERAIELHNLTLQVGASLQAVIALIEVSLRNLADVQIAKDFGEINWLQQPPASLNFKEQENRAISQAIQHAQKAQYAKLNHQEKKALDAKIYPHGVPANIKHETLSKKRWQTFSVSQGQLIAQTTIFFWKRLFSAEYEKTLWQRSLRKLFPDKTISRSDVAIHFEALYLSRNRVAHHEPVYGVRLEEAFDAIKYLRQNLLRTKDDLTSPFLEFTEVQFHRLYIDFTTFNRSWALLCR